MPRDSLRPFFRRGYGAGVGSSRGDDDGKCDARQLRERQQRFARQPDIVHPDYFHGCLDRAKQPLALID
jgi:hypothetical protein